MRRKHDALAERREPWITIDQAKIGIAVALPDRQNAEHLGQILADYLGAQLVEIELLHEVAGERPRTIEKEAAAVFGCRLCHNAIDDDLALRRQQCAEAGLYRANLGDIGRQKPIQKCPGVGAHDFDHAAIGEKCRFHAIPCCLQQRKPLMWAAQGRGNWNWWQDKSFFDAGQL